MAAKALHFDVGDYVVYPKHGVGRVIELQKQEIAGMQLELYVLRFEKEKMTLRVPTNKAESVGMRKLSSDKTMREAMETLKGKPKVKRTMWSRRAQEYEVLTIANCLMENGHGAVVMGSEMSGDITDVEITRCEFKGTDRGLRIKTRRGRGGQVTRIALNNVVMDGVGTALAVNAFYFCDADGKSEAVQSRDPAPVDETTPQIFDITIHNVELRRVRHAAGAFLGLPEAPVRGLRLSQVLVDYDPDALSGETLMACHLPRARHGGLLHRFAQIETDAALMDMLEDLTDVG